MTIGEYEFATDRDAEKYLDSIVEAMMRGFGLQRDEAIAHINSLWRQIDHVSGPEDLMYHETPEYWANQFYLGRDSYWWLSPTKRQEMNLPPMRAQPIE